MASLTQFPNPYGVTVQPLDYSVADAPTIQVYHGLSIVCNGQVVGRITSFHPTGAYTREGTHVYEISNTTWGIPVEYVPGKVTGFNFAMARAEVWQQEMEIQLGFTAVFDNLTDQTRPFQIQEFIFQGATIYRVWQYSGCWFTNKNPEAYTADGNGIISISSEVAYVSRIRTQ